MAMVSAMMKPIMRHVNMMVEIAVELLIQVIALNAFVFLKKLVMLDFYLYQLEMVYVMMKITIYIATLMDLIAVHLLLIHPFALNANAMVG